MIGIFNSRKFRRRRRQKAISPKTSLAFILILTALIVIYFFLSFFFPEDTTLAVPANNSTLLTPATVSRIIDGDTIDVIMQSGETERIRFIGIDAPEMGRFGVEEGAEPGAIEARDFVAELIPVGTIVWLESQGQDRDRWDRLRRYVWLESPTNVTQQRDSLTINRLLLTHGHAVVWP